jgi:hypothetical protein
MHGINLTLFALQTSFFFLQGEGQEGEVRIKYLCL